MIRNVLTVLICLSGLSSTSFAATKKKESPKAKSVATAQAKSKASDPRRHDPNDIRNPAGMAKYVAGKNGDTCPYANKSERVASNVRKIEPVNQRSEKKEKPSARANDVST